MGKKNKLKNRRQVFSENCESIKDFHGMSLTRELLSNGVRGESILMEAALQMFDELTLIGEKNLHDPLKMARELTREALYHWDLPLGIKNSVIDWAGGYVKKLSAGATKFN